jgi:hypothetical protein
VHLFDVFSDQVATIIQVSFTNFHNTGSWLLFSKYTTQCSCGWRRQSPDMEGSCEYIE